MKLYLVHCGFYDNDLCDGLYESHANYFIAAENFDEARKKAKTLPDYQAKKMHVDGVQEIQAVEGYSVSLTPDDQWAGKTQINNLKHRDLSTPKSPTV